MTSFGPPAPGQNRGGSQRKTSTASKKATRTIRNYMVVARGGGLVVVRVHGMGNMNTSPALRDFIDEQRSAGYRRFVFDLSKCRGMDSTFMGCLVGIHKSLLKESSQNPAVGTEQAEHEALRATARAAMSEDVPAREDEPRPLSREEALSELKRSLARGPGRQALKGRGPAFVIVVNASVECRELLNILGVDKFVKIHGEVDLSQLEMTALPEKKMSAAERRALILQAHENLVEIDKRNEAKFGAFLRTLSDELAKSGRPE